MLRSGTCRIATLLWVFLALAPVRAGESKRDHDITVDDYFTQADIFQSVIAPDGKYVAYTEGRWQKSTNARKADLWVVECATGKAKRLTSERASDRSPTWSRDGKTIYFLGNRKIEGDKR